MRRFLHAADLHLDSPLRGLAKYEGAPVEALERSLRGAVENMVSLAIDRKVSLVVIAGDVYDGDCRDFNTPLFFSRQMQRLNAAGIAVAMISGNHDAASKMTRVLQLPANVARLPVDAPDCVLYEKLGFAVHGQGFARASVLDNLALRYPAAKSGLFNIGLLHTCATGGEGHEPYAPCSLADLRARGYDYWALGHIHKHQVLATDPQIVFSGNVQGRDIGETGPKGCVIVEVDDRNRATLEFCPTDVFRWERVDVDVTAAQDRDSAIELIRVRLDEFCRAAEERPTAVRLTLAGATAAHESLLVDWSPVVEEIRNQAQLASDGRLWIEKVVARTKPYWPVADAFDSGGVSSEGSLMDGPLGELLTYVAELRSDDAALAKLIEETPELRTTQFADFLEARNETYLRQQLDHVEAQLVGLLQRGSLGTTASRSASARVIADAEARP